MTTVTAVEQIAALERPESGRRAEVETALMVDLLSSLDDHDWALDTECPSWTVRDMAGHVLGMTETFSSVRLFARNMRAGGKAAGDGPFIDGLTAVQVKNTASLTPSALVARLREAGPRNAAWRSSRRVMRNIPLKVDRRDGVKEPWKLAFLLDVVLTRDTWMHRVDIARATGRPMVLSPEHDGRIVANAVGEWARRHGRPFVLKLTGPAGGVFSSGNGGDEITIDAVEFCRTLSGRAPATGLLTEEVPF